MRTKPKSVLCLMIPALSCLLVFACGSSKNEKLQKNIGQVWTKTKKSIQASTVPTYKLSQAEFREYCRDLGGRLDLMENSCATRVIKQLPNPAQRAELLIDDKFAPGKYVQARGTSGGSVDITLNGRHHMDIPGDFLNNVNLSGELAFFVSGPGYSDITVTIWSCQDRNKDPVLCIPNSLPSVP